MAVQRHMIPLNSCIGDLPQLSIGEQGQKSRTQCVRGNEARHWRSSGKRARGEGSLSLGNHGKLGAK